jgi:hypothetical protein
VTAPTILRPLHVPRLIPAYLTPCIAFPKCFMTHCIAAGSLQVNTPAQLWSCTCRPSLVTRQSPVLRPTVADRHRLSPTFMHTTVQRPLHRQRQVWCVRVAVCSCVNVRTCCLTFDVSVADASTIVPTADLAHTRRQHVVYVKLPHVHHLTRVTSFDFKLVVFVVFTTFCL